MFLSPYTISYCCSIVTKALSAVLIHSSLLANNCKVLYSLQKLLCRSPSVFHRTPSNLTGIKRNQSIITIINNFVSNVQYTFALWNGWHQKVVKICFFSCSSYFMGHQRAHKLLMADRHRVQVLECYSNDVRKSLWKETFAKHNGRFRQSNESWTYKGRER